MKINALLLFFLSTVGAAFGQFTIDADGFAATGIISVSSDLDLKDSNTSGQATLILSGTDQNVSSSTPRSLPNLVIAGGGTKSLSGEFIITNGLSLQNGIVAPASGIVLAVTAQLDTEFSGSADSYIAGTLFRRVSEDRISFPIGTTTTYTPVAVSGATGTEPLIGIRANNSAASGVTLPTGILEESSNWFWEVVSPSPANFSTAIFTFPFLIEDKTQFGIDDDSYRPVVLYNEDGQVTANLSNTSINASVADETVTAEDPGSTGIYLLGKESFNTPIINNVITPDGNSMNDYLTVRNLDQYPENNIKLIDRYGVEVFTETNYNSPLADSAPGEGKDFSFLPPGNYVCILEYTDPVSGNSFKLREGVTVLLK